MELKDRLGLKETKAQWECLDFVELMECLVTLVSRAAEGYQERTAVTEPGGILVSLATARGVPEFLDTRGRLGLRVRKESLYTSQMMEARVYQVYQDPGGHLV